MPESAKVAISLAMRGIKKSPETIARMCVAQQKRREDIVAHLRGRPVSAETRKKMSDSQLGRPSPLRGIPRPDGMMENLRRANIGREFTPEHRAAISVAGKARWARCTDRRFSVEHRAAISSALRGCHRSDETRAKISAAKIGKKLSPETRAKMSTAMRVRMSSPETRAKMSEVRARQKFPFNNTLPERLVRDWLVARRMIFVPQGRIATVGTHCFDFILPQQQIAIEADGCYWHGCPKHFPGRSISQGLRDTEINTSTEDVGWTMVRLWEHEIKAGDFSKLECLLGN